MDWFLALLGGLGLGSLLKSVVDHFISRRAIMKDRLYQEKREAYVGLLGAIHKAAIEPSDEHSKDYGLWQARCQLFGSADVSRYAQAILDTNDVPLAKRDAAFRGLLASMKEDLQR